jgi:hypothetical protein
MLHVAVDEPALPIGPIAWAQIILIEWARNRGTRVFAFASCHLYLSNFLNSSATAAATSIRSAANP